MSGRIVVLEDEPQLREILTELLSDEGYSVTACGTPHEAHEAVAAGPCVVLADAWGESHHALVEQEREEIRALAGRAPTILLTGRHWGASARADDLGLLAVRTKTIDLDELLKLVAQGLEKVGLLTANHAIPIPSS